MKVLYPSLETVKQSQLGVEGGGTMFVGKAWMPTTRKLFHHSRSKRGGVLMHAKVGGGCGCGCGPWVADVKLITATFEPQERTLGFEPALGSASASGSGSVGSAGKRKADEMDEGPGGWIYVGSHNFSTAAWVRRRGWLGDADAGYDQPQEAAANPQREQRMMNWGPKAGGLTIRSAIMSLGSSFRCVSWQR